VIDMTRLRIAYVQSFRDKKTGAVFHYFRRAGFRRVRLPGLPGSTEFMAAYQAAFGSRPEPIGVAKRSKPGSVSAAIVSYYGSQSFRNLTGGTPAMRRAILERFRDQHGDKPIALMPKKFIVALLDQMEPFAARNWLKAIRALMHHCVEHELICENPTQGIKLPTIKSHGHHTWTEDEIAAFEAHYPIGSKARLAFALLLYTAQRRGDVIRMGRQHVRDGVLRLRQQKTGATLAIPVRPALQAAIDAMPGDHLTLLVTKSGKTYGATNFSEQFRKWCDDASLPRRCTAHGLRKAACRRLAEAGCSANEIAAISGHATLREVERYTRAADQARMAESAMAKTAAREQTRSNSVKVEGDRLSKPLMQLEKK
jgi:integrase